MKGDAANTANSAGRNMRVAPKIPTARSALIHHDERIRTANSEFWCSSNFMRSFWGQTPNLFGFALRRLAALGLLDQRFGGNPELAMQAPDHLERERALAVQHFVDPIELTDHGHQVFGAEARLLHAELDRLDRIGQVHGKVLRLVGLDQGGENVQPLSFGRAGSRSHEGFDLLQRRAVVSLRADRLDVHSQCSVTQDAGASSDRDFSANENFELLEIALGEAPFEVEHLDA